MIDLSAAGLTPTLTKAYSELVKFPSVAPAPFALRINETRTNSYKILDELVELGLAERFEHKKKLHYRARNPQHLLALAQARRENIVMQEKAMQEHVLNLTREFNQTSEQPGVRFYQGKESIRQVFYDMMETGEDIYFIRSRDDVRYFGLDFFLELLSERTKRGINTYGLTPDVPTAQHNPARDRVNNMFRTWFNPEDYQTPVEWHISGDKVAIISYGREAFATIIQSPQIADSLRQLFRILQVGAGGLRQRQSVNDAEHAANVR